MTQESGQDRGSYARGGILEAGTGVPEVEVLDSDGRVRRLAEEAREGWVLVYFFPRGGTPGCTVQACSLRDAFSELTGLGVRVFGVSTDKAARLKRFRERRGLPFPLLADTEKKAVKAFGVPTFFGVASRMAFLFRDGVLVWRDPRASTRRQAADVLAIVRRDGAAED